jgi:DNA-binding XRE family transcriptional regulator
MFTVTPHTIGRRLAELRERCGWSREVLAHELDITVETLGMWEDGTAEAPFQRLTQTVMLARETAGAQPRAMPKIHGVDGVSGVDALERAGMPSEARYRLLINPETGQVAAPALQRRMGCDPNAARWFPSKVLVASVTPGMGVFTVTDVQLSALVHRAMAKTASQRGPVAAAN